MKKTILILAAFASGLLTVHAESLLTEPPLLPAQQRAIEAQRNVQGFRDSIIGGLRHSITALWSDDYATNVDTAAALGSKGSELYQLYESFFTSVRALLVASGDTASVAELDTLAARVPALTVNNNGTITITPPEPQ